jgi:hypothetical protein
LFEQLEKEGFVMQSKSYSVARHNFPRRGGGILLIVAGSFLGALMLAAVVSESLLGDFFAIAVAMMVACFSGQMITLGRRMIRGWKQTPIIDPLAPLWRHPAAIRPFGSYPKIDIHTPDRR